MFGKKFGTSEPFLAEKALPGLPIHHLVHFHPIVFTDNLQHLFFNFILQLPHVIGSLNPILYQFLRSVLHFLEDGWELWDLLIVGFNPQVNQAQFEAQSSLIRVAGRCIVIVSMDPSQVQKYCVKLFAETWKLRLQ